MKRTYKRPCIETIRVYSRQMLAGSTGIDRDNTPQDFNGDNRVSGKNEFNDYIW